MVYETDFYTIRRPYTRPTITSYSVTGCRPMVWKTTTISPLGAQSKVRLSVLLGELNRIQNRPRMHLGYVPTEDFLNSRPLVAFDDETKYIRAEADKLMKYIYVPVPHQTSRIPPKITTCYDRLTGNGLNPYRYGSGLSDNILNISNNYEPTRATIGRGHLACVTFAGGRGYPRRKHLFADENRDIRDEIKVRSYYNKLVNPSARVEESLALPTGFAARLLLSDRKPLSETEREKKPIKTSRFRKTDINDSLGPKKERIVDKWLDPMITDKANAKQTDEELKIHNNVEILEEKLPSIKKFEDEIILEPDTVEPVSKFEPVTPPAKVEKVKTKKESRRKLSEKSAESEKIQEALKLSKAENDVPICEKEVEKPISDQLVETAAPIEEPPIEEPPIEESPIEEPSIVETIVESPSIKKDSMQNEQPLSRSISQNEPIQIEEKIPDNDLEIDKKAEELLNEEINKEEIKNITESIPDVRPEEQIIDNLEDKTTIEVVDKDEVKIEGIREEQIEEKGLEIKGTEELKEISEEDISKSVGEQNLECVQPEAEEEPKIECATIATDDVLETSIDSKQEPMESLNVENVTDLKIVESVKEDLTIIEMSSEVINQVDTVQPNDIQELINVSDITNDHIKDNTEPIVEEPLSPQDINITQISDDISTIQQEL